jgi:prephenate dehydrogenase
MRLEKVAVIGVGLIGGSFALALKRAKACGEVVGAGRSAANLKLALERGAIDVIASDPAAAARGADFVLIAAPVAQFESILQAIAPVLEAKTIVSDAGSTKRDVIAAAKSALGSKLAQFVPAHPIAGAEQSGVAAANAELFRNRQVVLTPLPDNPAGAVEKVAAAWAACGARITQMKPDEHDAVLAAVSHLPHVLAYALVHDIAGRPNSQQLFSYAAGGFRDFTRIASSHPEMWRDICVANRDRLLDEVQAFEEKLAQFKKLIEKGDGPALEKVFAEAREARNRWIRSS